jgi:uncharacterized damage-inducible protein DinB
MSESDPFQVLLSLDRWATAQMLDACGRLGEEQFHQRFEMGPGSLHDAMTHVISAMRAWTESLAGLESGPRLQDDGRRRTAGELRALHDEASAKFAAEVGRRPVGEKVMRRTRDGRVIELTRGAVLAQVVSHGVHHRAQCLNMLRQLGVTPLPASSVVEWAAMGEGRR